MSHPVATAPGRAAHHYVAATVLSLVVGLDSVSCAAFVRRLSGPDFNHYRTAALHCQLAGMNRRIRDRRVERVDVGAPHRFRVGHSQHRNAVASGHGR